MKLRALFETIHLAALGFWAGMLLMTGVAAAVTFPTLKRLDPSLPEYSGFEGDHWLIAAGSVMNKLFMLLDYAAIGFVGIALVTLIALVTALRVDVRRPSALLRMIGLFIAMCMTLYSAAVLQPRMRENLHAYWQAAQAGQNDLAAESQQAFEKDHPTSEYVMAGELGGVLLALFAGLWCATSPGRTSGKGEDPV